MIKPSLSRREILRSGLTAAGVLAASVPDWAIPALAQGETEVAFTDIPANFSTKRPNSDVQTLDIRTIDGLFTPADKFFALQHHDQPEVDAAGYKLQVTGLVDNPTTLSIEDLRNLPSTEIAAGYECSGNSPRATQALVSCGLWKGVRLRDLLDGIGVSSRAREVVFFGLDRGVEDVDFRGTIYKLEQQFGRSISIEKAMTPEPLLAYELNGAPLTRPQGFPLRVIMPGWYGVANVKWLGEIQLQQDRYVGKYQARWYRTIRGEIVDDDIAGQIDAMLAAPNPKEGDRPEPDASQVQWVETEVSRIQLKSVIARVTSRGNGNPDPGLRAERRHPAPFGGSEDRQRSVAAGDAVAGQHAVFLEAIHPRLDRSKAGRAYDRLPRHRHPRLRPAGRKGPAPQAELPGTQRPDASQGEDRLSFIIRWRGSPYPRIRRRAVEVRRYHFLTCLIARNG